MAPFGCWKIFFEGLEDRWTGGWPLLQMDLGCVWAENERKLEIVRKKIKLVVL
jgi:hypothetical protein